MIHPSRPLGERLRGLIRDVPDFPREGVLFKDITTLLGDAEAFRTAIDGLVDAYRDAGIEVVVGVESRGFVLGGALAYLLGSVSSGPQGRASCRPGPSRSPTPWSMARRCWRSTPTPSTPASGLLIVDDLLATGGLPARPPS